MDLKTGLEKVFKVQDERDRRIFYTILSVVLLILIYLIFIRGYFVRQEEKREAEEKAKMEQVRQERVEKIKEAPKSRISFFLVKPVRANLAIPDYWEGSYRLAEKGDKTTFLHIDDPSQTAEIFYIRLVSVKQLEELNEGEQEVDPDDRIKKGDTTYTFVYKMSSENPYKDNEELRGKLDRMKIDAREMIKNYFKTF